MSLATAVITPAADKNTASLFLQEAKTIKALLRQHEARAFMTVDLLNDPAREKLSRFLKGSLRRKSIWMYHHIGPIAPGRLQQIVLDLPDLKILYISGPIGLDQIQACFDAGAKLVLTTGSSAYGAAQAIFSQKFYAHLAAGARVENAFEQARIYVEMEHGQRIQKPMAFSQWQPWKTAEEPEVPWTLFYADGAESGLLFSLPQKSELKLVSKKDQYLWLKRQMFKDDFLKDWGKKAYQYHLLIIHDGPVGMAQIFQLVKEEACLPYQTARIRVLKIDFSPSLEEAKVKLFAQLQEAISLATRGGTELPVEAEGIIFLLKIYQSEWTSYGARLLESLHTTLPTFSGEKKAPDLVFIAVLIADQPKESKALSPFFSLKKISDSCKQFAPSRQIDFRL